MTAGEVLRFWFQELTPSDWFRKDPALDEKIRSRFGETLERAKKDELFSWRETPHGRLAEIIVLDQFSRNIYRGKKEAFAQDPMALLLAQELVVLELDRNFTPQEKSFAYMPFMHSECPVVHDLAVKLFSQDGLEENLRYEFLHREIIERFGRYPHRNEILGRRSTPEEIEFVREHPGF